MIPDLAVTLELRDPETGKIIGRVATVKSTAHNLIGPQELASYGIVETGVSVLFRTIRKGQQPPDIKPLDLTSDQLNLAMSNWLRERAKGLVGKTLYHPDHSLNAWADELMPEIVTTPLEEVKKLTAERDKLQAFKDFVHARLDAGGVTKNPNGPHSAEGCRIGDRLDIVLAAYAAQNSSTEGG